MGRRNARPLTFRPKGLSDAVDGSNAFPGAMTQLANLVHDVSTNNTFVPRPAATLLTNFSSFTSPAGITALLTVGARIYGMISSGAYAGCDQPFCYDTSVPGFVSIGGQSSALLPSTVSTTGDWQPPSMAMTANRIIVTHPGFAGGASPFFGWIDLTGFSLTTLVGNTTNGSKVIQSISGDGTSTPILDGVQPGQAITGAGIPANSYVTAVSNGTTTIQTTGTTHSTTTIDSIPASAVALMQIGMYVSGSGIVPGTYISALPGGGVSITLSQAATSGAAGVALVVTGGGTITINNNCTSNNNLDALSISGGTFASPVWGAGNTNVNPLKAVPYWVAQFNGRAWYAVNNGVQYSDSLLPLNTSLATQILTLGDQTNVTCLAGTPLTNITTGGVIQALVAFKDDEIMYQITGDQATNNLAINSYNVNVGTTAPNSVTSSPLGLSFVASDGLRVLDASGRISDPVGVAGAGVNVPFVNALTPTRITSAFNENTLRVSVQNGLNAGTPVQEFWLNFNEKTWSGPHTFPAQQIEPFSLSVGSYAGQTFVTAGYGINASLWMSGINPVASSSYVENGNQLTWAYQTVLLPDTEEMAQNRMGQSVIAMAMPSGQTISLSFVNEVGTVLNQVTISVPGAGPAVWGSFTWGAAVWGAVTGFFRQYNIPWTAPIIFKQGSLIVVGASQGGMKLGNLYLKYQPLGYLLNVIGASS